MSVELLASKLSEISHVEFILNDVIVTEARVTVDWNLETTLFTGLSEEALTELSQFDDTESLNWFMLDSLNDTIIYNLGVGEVYYTMDGGQELVVPNMPPLAMISDGGKAG